MTLKPTRVFRNPTCSALPRRCERFCGGTYCPSLQFMPSLQPEKDLEGVQNIILHFTHGWSAWDRIRDEWHGDDVWSRKFRCGSSFMRWAVDEFNSETKGIATTELSSEYKK